MSELAQWQSHKIVRAGKILSIDRVGQGEVTIEDCNGAPAKVSVPSNLFARGRANLGDYIIVYDDGYKSWSPAATFEEGYSKIPI